MSGVSPTAYVPESCVWELTLRCNMRCLHCGSTAGIPRENELSLEECLDVADQLVDLGCRRVTLIGGEVFLFPGWEEVSRRLVDRGATTNIITNGFMMGDRQISELRYSGVKNVGISIDGLELAHNRIRNVGTSFERAMQSLQRLREAGIPSAAVTSLVTFNVGDLPDLYEVLVQKGVVIWQLQIVTAMGNMEAHSDLVLGPEQIPAITRFIREVRDRGEIRAYAGDDVGYYDENEMYLRNAPGTLAPWRGCQAGLRVVGIDSVGNVKGCESLYDDSFIEGNLREESLATIWNDETRFAYNRQFDVSMLTGGCAGCDKGEICRGGCRGACHFTSGSMYENPYCAYPGKPAAAVALTCYEREEK